MRIYLGTRCYTEYPKDGRVPHDKCNKKCSICYLWYQGWSVRRFKLGFITLLQWERPSLSNLKENQK